MTTNDYIQHPGIDFKKLADDEVPCIPYRLVTSLSANDPTPLLPLTTAKHE